MKDVIMHVIIVIFGCLLLARAIYLQDEMRVTSMTSFTIAWTIVLIIHIYRFVKKK